MKITVLGVVLIVAGAIVVFLLLDALNKKDGGDAGAQPPQGPEKKPWPSGA